MRPSQLPVLTEGRAPSLLEQYPRHVPHRDRAGYNRVTSLEFIDGTEKSRKKPQWGKPCCQTRLLAWNHAILTRTPIHVPRTFVVLRGVRVYTWLYCWNVCCYIIMLPSSPPKFVDSTDAERTHVPTRHKKIVSNATAISEKWKFTDWNAYCSVQSCIFKHLSPQ